jgi:hypothetical protein
MTKGHVSEGNIMMIQNLPIRPNVFGQGMIVMVEIFKPIVRVRGSIRFKSVAQRLFVRSGLNYE